MRESGLPSYRVPVILLSAGSRSDDDVDQQRSVSRYCRVIIVGRYYYRIGYVFIVIRSIILMVFLFSFSLSFINFISWS